MSSVFISYRRGDSIATAGRIRDRLVQELGRANVFVDIDDIAPGQDFVRLLADKIAACKVLLAIIGPGWICAADENGNRRLDDPEDFVALEIASALEKPHIQVIPVLIDGAKMPTARELPDRLKPIARRNAIEVRNSQFSHDAERLIQAIRTATGAGRRVSAASLAGLGLAAAAVAIAGWVAYPQLLPRRPEPLVPAFPAVKPTTSGPIEPRPATQAPPSTRQTEAAGVDVALDKLTAALAGAQGRLTVAMRGGTRIELGKEIVFEAKSELPGRLILIDINAAGEVTQIFPNRYVTSEAALRISSEQSITVPGSGYGFTAFKAVEPVGRGKVIGLVVPDSVPQERLVSIETARSKGLVPVNAPADYLDGLIRLARDGGADKSTRDGWGMTVLAYEIVK